MTHDHVPAFDGLPTAGDIAAWFLAEKRGQPNEGGDAWYLSRDPHSACTWYAHVDHDTQEFWLLNIYTQFEEGGDGFYDLLWVTDGYDGKSVAWWQHPVTSKEMDHYWHRDGLAWMADQIVVHYEAIELREAIENAECAAIR